jgi:hypothetical protein
MDEFLFCVLLIYSPPSLLFSREIWEEGFGKIFYFLNLLIFSPHLYPLA